MKTALSNYTGVKPLHFFMFPQVKAQLFSLSHKNFLVVETHLTVASL